MNMSVNVPNNRRFTWSIVTGQMLVQMPGKPAAHAKPADPRALLEFPPVFRNRAAMAWIAGYTFLGDGGTTRLGRHVPDIDSRAGRRTSMAADADRSFHHRPAWSGS
jgi:hypothetical protein